MSSKFSDTGATSLADKESQKTPQADPSEDLSRKNTQKDGVPAGLTDTAPKQSDTGYMQSTRRPRRECTDDPLLWDKRDFIQWVNESDFDTVKAKHLESDEIFESYNHRLGGHWERAARQSAMLYAVNSKNPHLGEGAKTFYRDSLTAITRHTEVSRAEDTRMVMWEEGEVPLETLDRDCTRYCLLRGSSVALAEKEINDSGKYPGIHGRPADVFGHLLPSVSTKPRIALSL